MPGTGKILTGSKYVKEDTIGRNIWSKVSATPNTVTLNQNKFSTKYKNASQTTLTEVSMTIDSPTIEDGSKRNDKSTKKVYKNIDRALQYKASEDQVVSLYNDVINYKKYQLDWKFLHHDGFRKRYGEAKTSSVGSTGAEANQITFNNILTESPNSDTVISTLTQVGTNILAREVKYTTRYHGRFTYGYQFDCGDSLTYSSLNHSFDTDELEVFRLYDKVQVKIKDSQGVVYYYASNLNITVPEGKKSIGVFFDIPAAAYTLIKNLLDAGSLDYWSSTIYVGTGAAPDLDLKSFDKDSLDYQDELIDDGIEVDIQGWSPVARDPYYIDNTQAPVVSGSLTGFDLIIKFSAEKFGVDLSSIRIQYDEKGTTSSWINPTEFYTLPKLEETVADAHANDPYYDEDNYDEEFYIQMAGVNSSTDPMYVCDSLNITYSDGVGDVETFTGIVPVKNLAGVKIDEFKIYKNSLTKITPARDAEKREIYEWGTNSYLEIVGTSDLSTYDTTTNTVGVARPYVNAYKPGTLTAIAGESNIFKSFKIEILNNKEISTFEFETRKAGLGSFQISAPLEIYHNNPTLRYYQTTTGLSTEGEKDTVGIIDHQKNVDLKLRVSDGWFSRSRKIYGKKNLEEIMEIGIADELILPQNMRANLVEDVDSISGEVVTSIVLSRDITSTNGKMYNSVDIVTLKPPTAVVVYKDIHTPPVDVNVKYKNPPVLDDDFLSAMPVGINLKYTLDQKYVDKEDKIHYIITKIFDNDSKSTLLDLYTENTNYVEVDPLGTWNVDDVDFDGYIWRGQPTNTYLNSGDLWIGCVQNGEQSIRSMIKPDLSGLGGAEIISASLELTPESIGEAGVSSNSFHGIQAMRAKKSYYTHLSWNKWNAGVSWLTPGVLSPELELRIDEMVENDDYVVEQFFGVEGEDDYIYWDADSNSDPIVNQTRSFEFNSTGVAWLQDLADNVDGLYGMDSMLLYDARQEMYTAQFGYNFLAGWIKFDSSEGGSSNKVNFAIEYHQVELGRQEDVMVQELGHYPPDEWVPAEATEGGASWVDAFLTFKVKINGSGFIPGTDDVEFRFYNGSTWSGWGDTGIDGYYTERDQGSSKHTNGVATDDWVYPIYLVDWGYLNSGMNYKLQFRVNYTNGTKTSNQFNFDFDKDEPSEPVMDIKESVNGTTIPEGTWTNINTPACHFASTDSHSGVDGYSIIGIPPGGPDVDPDEDTIINDGGYWTTEEYFDTAEEELPEGE